MLVGWGGNNGSTVTAGILANRYNITWNTKKGKHIPNFYGSITQASTTKIGLNGSEEVFLALNEIVPMVDPKTMVLGGWDISHLNLADSMARAQVVDYDLQRQLRPYMEKMQPLKGIYYPHFIASNQKDRADHTLPGDDKWAHMLQIRNDIANFKKENSCDKVIVMWSANTECFSDLVKG
jgi:myo-inositol-1-phosphate synthase